MKEYWVAERKEGCKGAITCKPALPYFPEPPIHSAPWLHGPWFKVVEKSEYDRVKILMEMYLKTLEKIAEAERMGYGTQRTYGAMAQAAIKGQAE